jgi:hypothetical protein
MSVLPGPYSPMWVISAFFNLPYDLFVLYQAIDQPAQFTAN